MSNREGWGEPVNMAGVDLVEIERVEAVVGVIVGQKEKAFGDYSPGRWAWRLANPVLFDEPVPWRGALGLWSIAT